MRALLRLVVVLALGAGVPTSTFASPVLIDFESSTELDPIGSPVAGVSFSNAIALTAGSVLNEFEFPPHSGVNVASDDFGPMRIDFAAPVSNFQGFFTYLTPLTLEAFDAADSSLALMSSASANNMALSGDPGSSPNELLALLVGGIAYVTITGDPLGGSFVVDDVSFQTVPEPATVILASLGVAVLVRRVRITPRCG